MNAELCITSKNKSIIVSNEEIQELSKAIKPSTKMYNHLHTVFPEDESIAKFNNIYESMTSKLTSEELKKIELPYLSYFHLVSAYSGYARKVVCETRNKGIEAEKDVLCMKLNELYIKLNSFFHSL